MTGLRRGLSLGPRMFEVQQARRASSSRAALRTLHITSLQRNNESRKQDSEAKIGQDDVREKKTSSANAEAGPSRIQSQMGAEDGRTNMSSEQQRQVNVAWHSNLVRQLREVVQRKRSDLEPRLKEHLADLGKRWNEYSGYEEVLEAKAQVLAAEVQLKELRNQQTLMRKEYMAAVSRRATSQRTLNELLVRKATWSEGDLAAYTDLLKSEHSDARTEREATERYEEIGTKVNAAWDNVVRTTLERYHLEQVWSDRVRAGSTYGSLIVAGINVVIFALALLIFEPYKRRKLAKTFETRLLRGEEQNTAMLAAVVQQFESRIEGMQSQSDRIDAALELLLQQAGVPPSSVAEHADKDVASDASDPERSSHGSAPAASPSVRQATVQDRRREMGMAAAFGFAVGAGLLAAFGALHS